MEVRFGLNPIEISHVTKVYGSLRAIDDVSLTVNEGEIFSLLGRNGAGKTTLIEILEGVRKRDEGEVKILGLDPWEKGNLVHRRIGVVPQQFTFVDKSTPREAVKYYANLFGVKVDADEILKEVLLQDSADVLFERLSGGQKQKVGLALALVNSPELLFLDEPTTGLDPSARRAVWDVVGKFKRSGKTIILTTHYLEEAERLSDRVAIIDHGRRIAIGTCNDIIVSFGSGERLEVHGGEELARYIVHNTKLTCSFDGISLISISMNGKHDAYTTLAAIEESHLPWTDLQTRRDSLEDIFVKLTGAHSLEEHREIRVTGHG